MTKVQNFKVPKVGGMSVSGVVRRCIDGVNKHLARQLIPWATRIEGSATQPHFLGDGDGAWPVLKLTDRAVCYCVGVGTNASFGLALAELGHEVQSFDPAPLALDYVSKNGLRSVE